MRKASYRAWARAMICGATALWAIACTSGNGDGGGDGSTECEPGTERCSCDNGTCDANLTCLSDVCVRGTSGSGGTQGGSAGASTGGSPQGGSGASPTGGAGSGAGGGATGGTSGSAGANGGISGSAAGSSGGGGGSAGASGAGGAAGMCTANTQTDPENCGSCGRVCRYELWDRCNDSCCMDGVCNDGFGECIRAADGFETCDDYCASIGEECVQQGCGTNTYRAWSAPDTCEQFAASVGDYNDACDAPIDFESDTIRCCCTDRAP